MLQHPQRNFGLHHGRRLSTGAQRYVNELGRQHNFPVSVTSVPFVLGGRSAEERESRPVDYANDEEVPVIQYEEIANYQSVLEFASR